jgi:O-antigen/teichoic acid export membrane protein
VSRRGELRQGTLFVAVRFAQYGVVFVSTVIVARILEPAGRAEYAVPLALAGVIASVVHLSLDGAAGRILGRREATAAEVSRGLAFMTLVLSAVGLLACVALGLLGRDLFGEASTATILLAAATIPFVLVVQMVGYMLIVEGRLRAFAVAGLSASVLQLLAVIALWAADALTPASAVGAALAFYAANAVALAVVHGRGKGAHVLAPRLAPGLGRNLLSSGLAFHAGSVALQAGVRMDLLLVGVLTDERETGWYSLAVTLSESTFLVLRMLAMTAIKRQTWDEQSVSVEYTYSFTRQTLSLAVGLAVLSSLLAYPFVTFVYGDEWAGAVVPLILLIVATTATTVEGPARAMLGRIGSPSRISALAVGGLVLNLALTALLVPAIGIAGAGVASLIAFWLYAVAIASMLARMTGRPLRDMFALPRRDDEVSVLARRLGTRVRELAARPHGSRSRRR